MSYWWLSIPVYVGILDSLCEQHRVATS
ncbi:hypothetical protein F383_30336 [Gossypium arboreum]|uniref:Uncharacterized protein n=1 Tax=Gossypium arboreum TaxID=29729 RepID=A0A0B0MYF0_GOSAR|nr:hypothetical protein F383_30336 [Gossypium arboreum]